MKFAERAYPGRYHSCRPEGLKRFFRPPVLRLPRETDLGMMSGEPAQHGRHFAAAVERKPFPSRGKSDQASNDKLIPPEYHKHLLHK
jgi:hypothetical protein